LPSFAVCLNRFLRANSASIKDLMSYLTLKCVLSTLPAASERQGMAVAEAYVAQLSDRERSRTS